MKQISVMLKPASGLCNMRCAYCFYADLSERREIPNYGKMSAETAHKIIDNVFADLSAGDRALFAFQGGEPTMAGIPFLLIFSAMPRKIAAASIWISLCRPTDIA